MQLFFGDTSIEIQPGDNSKAIDKVRAVDTLTLYFSMPGYTDIPVGAWTIFEGKRYELLDAKNFKKLNARNFEYTLVLEDDAGKLRRYKHRDTTTRRLKFEYTATPRQHIEMLVDNLNRRDPGWTVGDCIEAVEKNLAFNHTNCHDALEQITDAFGTEWEVVDKRISLHKVEYFKDNPLPLSYGQGKGFKSGVGQTNQKKTPVEILFPQGGTRNIDAFSYGSTELLLPESQAIGFDGTTFYYDPSEVPAGRDVKWYVSDADGFSISRKDKPFVTFAEESLDCSHIYPSRVGTVSEVIVVDAAKNLYDIVDDSIPDNLDFTKFLIQGATLTIIPQDGMLAGKEFDAKYIHADRRFEIVPQDLDGRTMPDEIFAPFVGQKYAVFGMMMPDAYVCDNASHTGASWDMLRECARFFYDNEDPHFSFSGELDSIWAQRDWVNIGGRIRKGAFVLFSDPQFYPDGADIRIVSVTRPVNTPKKPKIELSNATVSGNITGELNKITENEVVAERLQRDAIQYTKRRYQDAEEHLGLVEKAVQGFEDGISPSWVHTMAALFGHDTLQFVFVDNKTEPRTIDSGIQYDNEAKVLTAPASIIQHKTIGITSLSPSHAASEYTFWDLPAFESARLDTTGAMYVYAKCSKTDSTGEFMLSATAIDFDNADGNYYLLIGTLSSERNDYRSYVECYGFTEIGPGRITLWKLVDPDGFQFWDMLNGAFRIGNADTYVDYNTKGDKKLRIKGTIFQSDEGDEIFIGRFRGPYDPNTTYHPGDEVTYTVDGSTSTYRFIAADPATGIVPTNPAYWAIRASAGSNGADGADGASGKDGSDGADGAYYVNVYRSAATAPATPTGAALPPSGWSLTPTAPSDTLHVWMSQAKVSGTGGVGSWSAPIRISGLNGAAGVDGTDVEFIYQRTTSSTAPSQPATSQADDYVPTGWTDDPQGVTSSYLYEWVSVRYKKAGTWSAFTAPAVWAKYGETGASGKDGADGKDGTDGSRISQVYKASATKPAAPTGTNPVPDGWSEQPIDYVYDAAPAIAYSGDTWTAQTDGYRQSPVIADSGITKQRLTFTTTEHGAVIDFEIYSSSETSYDFMLIGKPNDDTLTRTSGYTDRVSGIGASKVVSITFPTAGTNYIEVAYAKDSSASRGDDYGKYRILGIRRYAATWMSKSVVEKNSAGAWVATGWSDPIAITGQSGDYFEYRYAVNGSRTVPPALVATSAAPSGWSTTMPTTSSLQYLWCTVAKKNAAGVLIQNWSTPQRITGADGKDGANGADGAAGATGEPGPTVVYRGVYASDTTYYGTSRRVDCVKYNNTYYIARIDAGNGFSGTTPTSTTKWNDFGAQFDMIATNLLLAEGASIGSWFVKAGQIVSTMDDSYQNRILIQVGYYSGSTFIYQPKIVIEAAAINPGSTSSSYSGSTDSGLGSVITLDATQGVVRVDAKSRPSYSTATSYMSPTGVFANMAGTEAMPASSGVTHRGAIVGLGFANVNKSDWSFGADETIIAGVYGRASNYGTAPAFGGYFWNLKACGMVFNRKYVGSSTTYLSASDSLVIGLVNSGITTYVYLPLSPVEGQVVFVMQMGAGTVRVDTRDGSGIYDDTSENTYYDISEGYTAMFTFGKWNVTSGSTGVTTAVNVWCVGRFKF